MRKVILLMCMLYSLSWSAFAQNRQITGKVADKGGEALIGVSVLVKGTSQGVSTDVSGNFKINVANPANAILVFKYLGFKTKEVPVAKQTQINVVLEDDATTLQEVQVNIGYGTVKRESLTGSVSSVGAKDLVDFPVSTAAEALSGKLAGVTVTTTEGTPGADVNIRVRGGTSLTYDNAPLYIVDGVPVDNALSLISPTEIQSIDVLKDVASTSIYGARGANGVILITTKGGKDMRTVVTFDAYAGSRQIVNELDVMNPYDFVSYQYQLYNYNTDQTVKDAFTSKYGAWQDLDIYKSFPKIDWQDKVFGREAFSNTQSLAITGGTKATSFNITVNNTKEDGIMLESGFRRTFASMRFDHNISEKFKAGINVRYSRQRVDGVGTSSTGSQSTNRLRNAVRYQPYNGSTVAGDEFSADFQTTGLTNPVELAHNELKYDYKNDLISSGYLSYSPLKNLTVKTLFGVTSNERETNTFNGSISYVGRQNGNLPAIALANASTLVLTNTNTIDYRPNIGKDHTLSFLVGEETYNLSTNSTGSTIKWFPAEITADEAFASIQKAEPPAGSLQDKPTSTEYGNRLLSFFGRAMYSYQGKYNATLSFRRDGSSLFGPENKYGNFPSAQFAWRISEEKFMKDLNLNWLNNLKMRLSYGSGGNNRIDPDLFHTMFVASSTEAGYASNDASVNTGLYASVLANPSIRWETTISKNIGLDADMLNGRLTASVDIYDNRTKDLLLLANVPQSSGYLTQSQNVGKTQNKGIELQLSGQIIKKRDFSYTSSFNIALNRNKILALQKGVTSFFSQSGWVNSLSDFKVQVGKSVGQYYGYVSDGYYTLDDFTTTVNAAGLYTYTLKADIPNARALLGNRDPQPGDMKVKKLSTSSSMLIGEDDKAVLGTSQPKFTGGFNNQFRYKNFDMSIAMNFSYGSKVYNANKIEFSSQYNVKDNNLLSLMNNRWKWFDENGIKVTDPVKLAEMNQGTKYWTPTVGNYELTSFAVEDGSFLRISNVTLGYSLPAELVKRTKAINSIRVYATVNNLYTLTNYSGFDPEASTRKNALTPGVDYAAYPRSRYILAGLNVTF